MGTTTQNTKYFDKLDEKKLEVPSVTHSEELIAKDAPDAIRFLERNNIDDLYEALGLSNYVRTKNV